MNFTTSQNTTSIITTLLNTSNEQQHEGKNQDNELNDSFESVQISVLSPSTNNSTTNNSSTLITTSYLIPNSSSNQTTTSKFIAQNDWESHLNVNLTNSQVELSENSSVILSSELAVNEKTASGNESANNNDRNDSNNSRISSDIVTEDINSTNDYNHSHSLSHSISLSLLLTTTQEPISISDSKLKFVKSNDNKGFPSLIHGEWDNEPNETINGKSTVVSSSFIIGKKKEKEETETERDKTKANFNCTTATHVLKEEFTEEVVSEIEIRNNERMNNSSQSKNKSRIDPEWVSTNCTTPSPLPSSSSLELSNKLASDTNESVTMVNEPYQAGPGIGDSNGSKIGENIQFSTTITPLNHDKIRFDDEKNGENRISRIQVDHHELLDDDVIVTKTESNGNSTTSLPSINTPMNIAYLNEPITTTATTTTSTTITTYSTASLNPKYTTTNKSININKAKHININMNETHSSLMSSSSKSQSTSIPLPILIQSSTSSSINHNSNAQNNFTSTINYHQSNVITLTSSDDPVKQTSTELPVEMISTNKFTNSPNDEMTKINVGQANIGFGVDDDKNTKPIQSTSTTQVSII